MARSKKHKTKKTKKTTGFPVLASVKVVGIGGGGGNAVERMSRNFTRGVDFVAINTDHQDLDQCDVRQKIYIGRNLTRGLGTGMNPDLGRQAAEENRSEISEALKGADLIFLTAGLGGGTGTGATPIVAEAAKQTGALTIAVVTRPFAFEGSQRERLAQEGLIKLRDKVDAIIVVPNDRVFTIISKDTPIIKAFEAIDDVLRNALRGLVDVIASPGIINVDFADVRAILQDAGTAIVGVGSGTGQERATTAINAAINSPLLELSAEGTKAVLLGISGGSDMKMTEINEAAKLVSQMADPAAKIIFGAYRDRSLRPNSIRVTLIATGFNGAAKNSLFSTYGNGLTSPVLSRAEGLTTGGSASSVTGRVEGLTNGGNRRSGVFGVKEDEISVKPAVASRMASSVSDENVADKSTTKKAVEEDGGKKEDVWDIPAFLRKRKK